MSASEIPSPSFVVVSGKDRYDDPGAINADRVDLKVSGADTGGRFALFEYHGCARGGPPLHLHHDQDEIFVVRSGEYLFQCGDARSHLTSGDTIFLPRGIPHTFAQVSTTGSLSYMFTPAGDMEAFFAALSGLVGMPTPAEGAALFAAHGMAVVGLPLATD